MAQAEATDRSVAESRFPVVMQRRGVLFGVTGRLADCEDFASDGAKDGEQVDFPRGGSRT
jgi:hypothetical protein